MPDSELLPEIVIDDSNPDYVETDEEEPDEEEPRPKTRPPAHEIFQGSKKPRPKPQPGKAVRLSHP